MQRRTRLQAGQSTYESAVSIIDRTSFALEAVPTWDMTRSIAASDARPVAKAAGSTSSILECMYETMRRFSSSVYAISWSPSATKKSHRSSSLLSSNFLRVTFLAKSATVTSRNSSAPRRACGLALVLARVA